MIRICDASLIKLPRRPFVMGYNAAPAIALWVQDKAVNRLNANTKASKSRIAACLELLISEGIVVKRTIAEAHDMQLVRWPIATTTIRRVLTFGFGIFCVLSVVSCAANGGLQLDTVALEVRTAINTNDVKSLARLVVLPLNIRQQQWESTGDGIGFKLSEYDDIVVSRHEELLPILQKFVRDVQIGGDTPITDDVNVSQFSEELSGVETEWANLSMILFLRGMGDVEHVVALGFDPKTSKLSAIYIN
jgi:hypothetical protein